MTIASQTRPTLALTPSEAAAALATCIAAGQPACLWGDPGIGKSDVVRQTAARLGLACVDVRVALLDPVDLRGLPTLEDGRTRWAPPEFLPRDGAGVLLLDELNRGTQMAQNACLQLVRDRRLGEYELPAGWTVVAACNPTGVGTGQMSEALAGRFVHLDVTHDLKDWSTWAVAAGLEPLVIAYVRFQPDDLCVPLRRGEKSGPSPRTWEFVSRIGAQRPPRAIERALVAGAVGHERAVKYMAFAELFRQLPSIDAILLNPTAAPVPTAPATQYAVASALAQRADHANLGRVLQYLARLPVEFGVYAVRDATTRAPALAATAEFTAWAVAHQDVL